MSDELSDLSLLPRPEKVIDPTYGHDLAKLMAIQPPDGEPADFASFWRETFDENRRRFSDVHPTVEPEATDRRGWGEHELFQVKFDSWGPVRLHGWLAVPLQRPARYRLVVGHGYGGRLEPDESPLLADAAIFYPCFRGLGCSPVAGLSSEAYRHVIHGLESKETYVHRFCACDLWNAATALTQLVPEPVGPLGYVGGSFGGGLGALALPWDDRFAAAALSVPSFGHHPLRLTMPCTGSGEAVRVYHRHRPGCAGVLAYFDAATAAAYLRIPTLFCCALFDPSVPPPGQFAVHHAASGSKELLVLKAGHTDWPGVVQQNLQENQARMAWLKRWLSASAPPSR